MRYAVCFATILLLFVTARATPDNKLSHAHGGKDNIMVLSVIGDRFTTVSLGGTAFDKKTRATAVPGWRVDDFVETTIKDALRESGSVRFPSFRIKRARVAKIYDTGELGFWEDGDFDLDRVADVVSVLRRKRVDKLVLVIARETEDPIEGANAKFRGYGMYRNQWLRTKHYVYAYLGILVIDVSRGELQHESEAFGYQKIDKRHWAMTPNEMKSASRYLVKDTLRRLMAGKIVGALAETDLLEAAVADKQIRQFQRPPRRDAIVSGDEYVRAVKRVYAALNMRRVFERYAWNYTREQSGTRRSRDAAALYADTIRAWVDAHVHWDAVRRPLVLSYMRLGLSANELNDIAILAEERAGAAPFSREDMRRLRAVWQRVVNDENLAELDRAMADRRREIIREAQRIRR